MGEAILQITDATIGIWAGEFEVGSLPKCHRERLELKKALPIKHLRNSPKRVLLRRGFLSGSFWSQVEPQSSTRFPSRIALAPDRGHEAAILQSSFHGRGLASGSRDIRVQRIVVTVATALRHTRVGSHVRDLLSWVSGQVPAPRSGWEPASNAFGSSPRPRDA
jgi:hypothetical protein